jgi:outer membrane protein assembly factor BamB
VIKDNHYSEVGSYCSVEAFCPADRNASNPASPEEFFITQLNPTLGVEWKFKNVNTESCSRNPDGSITCVSDHPNSFEWCVNALAIDSRGVVYVNSEDGNLYTINQGGTLRQKIFQQLALGAAYTPASLGSDGKIYSQNAGRLFVVGQ